MKKRKHFIKENLVIAVLFSNTNLIPIIKNILTKKFGQIDYESDLINFDFTEYYNQEMGNNIKRCFFSFKKLINPSKLARIKTITNNIEKNLMINNKRLVNLDPGILSCAKFILASAKDFAHRIPLRKSIYAEVTLIYQDKNFKDLEWTFSDYRTQEYKKILSTIRNLYLKKLKQNR